VIVLEFLRNIFLDFFLAQLSLSWRKSRNLQITQNRIFRGALLPLLTSKLQKIKSSDNDLSVVNFVLYKICFALSVLVYELNSKNVIFKSLTIFFYNLMSRVFIRCKRITGFDEPICANHIFSLLLELMQMVRRAPTQIA
jgi:hypothetical protein